MKNRLFYGWYIVAAGLIVTTVFAAVILYGFTGFVNPIMTTFGWSYAQISLASSLRGLESGVFNPVWGIAVDRWSPKKLMLFGVITTSLGLFFLSQTRNLLMYYAGFLIMGLGSSLVIGIVPTTVISRWFKKNIGKANGIFYVGMGIGGAMVPLVVKIIDNLSWQSALLFAAVGFLALGVPLSFVFRSRPQDYGLLPDGASVVENADTTPGSRNNHDTSAPASTVLRTRAFYHIVLVVFVQFATLGVIGIYLMPYLTSLGMDRTTGSVAVMLYTGTSIFGRIPFGMLSDVFPKNYIIAIVTGLMGIGACLLWYINEQSPFWMILVFGIIYGLGLSGVGPLRAPILVQYFGTRNFGAIFGLSSIFVTIATVTSSPLAGWFVDTYGNYKPIWLVLAGFTVIGVILMLTIPPVQKK